MPQEWAKHLYKSPAWRKNRKHYLNAILDTSGNVLTMEEVDGRFVYVARDDPYKTPVPDAMVIPPGMCERCFKMCRYTPAKVVHHIEHLTPENVNDPRVALSYDNLMRLCQDCHAFVHSGQTEPRATFDEDGNLVPIKETFAEMVMRLTETVDERRNFHSRKPTKEDR